MSVSLFAFEVLRRLFYFISPTKVSPIIIICFCLSLDTEKNRVKLRKSDWQEENGSKNKHYLFFSMSWLQSKHLGSILEGGKGIYISIFKVS